MTEEQMAAGRYLGVVTKDGKVGWQMDFGQLGIG